MTKEELVQEGKRIEGIKNFAELNREYNSWCSKVRTYLRMNIGSEEVMHELNVRMHYTENEFSREETYKSLVNALERVRAFLEENCFDLNREISKSMAILIIERILQNFHMHYRAMYQNEIHKNGTLTKEKLEAIEIGNEYDLQRMLYSLILPIFPTARMEVNSDNGYGGMRADIWLEEYKIVIETKCTRSSMSEKRLLEELGADGFHYQADMIFFFVYDKDVIIRNPIAFENAFARTQETGGKEIKTVVMQPVIL